ncbi:MAG: hypothetical protein KA715_01435 [Xanthomonadaceae bacterium]|nr:hypothetical protein [Xanthomonadaceae bacterium]
MAERIIALTFLWMVAGASALAQGAELSSHYHVSTLYKDTQGHTHSLPPVRVLVKHDSQAGALNISAGENCSAVVGKRDFLGLFSEEESFHCVSDGDRIFISKDVLSKILERSIFYSIRFSRENEIESLLNDFRSTGKVSKIIEKDDYVLIAKLQSWFSRALGDISQVHRFSLKDETDFKLKVPGVLSEFMVKLEFVSQKGVK